MSHLHRESPGTIQGEGDCLPAENENDNTATLISHKLISAALEVRLGTPFEAPQYF
jgi:hypothetical protein